MHRDPIRKALEPYMADVDILHDDPGGVTVKPYRDSTDDKSFLRWYEINSTINRLGGSWVKATRFTEGHWRIPK
jgi:hypothetical protein